MSATGNYTSFLVCLHPGHADVYREGLPLGVVRAEGFTPHRRTLPDGREQVVAVDPEWVRSVQGVLAAMAQPGAGSGTSEVANLECRKAGSPDAAGSAAAVGGGAWVGADLAKPETFDSVIVWGLLEDDSQLDAHEGFWCGRNWWSVRQNETAPLKKMKLSGVTYWMPRPQAPNAKDEGHG